jgi:hypothetical protein
VPNAIAPSAEAMMMVTQTTPFATSVDSPRAHSHTSRTTIQYRQAKTSLTP